MSRAPHRGHRAAGRAPRSRSLARRVAALSDGRHGEDLVLAVKAIATTGIIVPGSPAAELWADAGRQGFGEPELRLMWCVLEASGRSLVEYLAEEDR